MTIPANADATIASLKSYDTDRPAAPGTGRPASHHSPSRRRGIAHGPCHETDLHRTVTNLEHTIAAKVDRTRRHPGERPTTAARKTRPEKDAFDTLTSEIKGLESEREDIRVLEVDRA